MDKLARITARLIRAGKDAYGRKWSFLGIFLLAFGASVGTLARLDLLPEAPKAEAIADTAHRAALMTTSSATVVSIGYPEEPVKIEIPAINLSAAVANPESTSIEVLDQYLLTGAVRYPGSIRLNEEGNLVLFGHSSYLPVVNNPAMKTFNGIQKLSPGDRITLSSSNAAYTYVVRSVTKAAVADGAIPLSVSGRVLTLVTCNSFASKDDRFVVTADFVESHPLGA